MGLIYNADTARATAVGSQSRMRTLSNGVQVAITLQATIAIFEYSTNEGDSWTAVANINPANSGSGGGPFPMSADMSVDEDDNVHFVITNHIDTYRVISGFLAPQNAARTSWVLYYTANGGQGGTNVYNPTIVAHRRSGGGWIQHVVYNMRSSNSGQENCLYYRPMIILSPGNNQFGAGEGVLWNRTDGGNLFPSIAVRHTGDGRTLTNSPDLFLGWSAGATGGGGGLQFMKGTHNSGAWTWGPARALDTTRVSTAEAGVPRLLFDGTRCVMAGMTTSPQNSIVIIERDAADTVTTPRVAVDNPSAAQTVLYGTATWDTEGNVLLFGGEQSSAAGSRVMGVRKWERASQTLQDRVTLDATTTLPYVSAGPPASGGIPYMYTDGASSPWAVTSGRVSPPTPAPTLTAPADGAVFDFADPFTVAWQIADGYTQASYSIRRILAGGGTSYWDGSTWVGAAVYVISTAPQVTFPAGAWGANGTQYSYSVSTRAAGRDSTYSDPRTLYGRARPTVTVTAPASDGATVTTSGPTITISGTAASGATLTASTIRVLTQADYTASGPTGPAAAERVSSTYVTSFTVPARTLQNGQYVAVARVRQSGDQDSAWAVRTFTVSQTVLPTPTVAATAPPTGTPRIDLAIAWSRGSSTGAALATVQRLVGSTWTTIGTISGGSAGDIATTLPDYTAPTGAPSSYRVRVDTDGNPTGQSPWSATSTATLVVLREALVDASTGAYASLALASSQRTTRPWQGEVIYPLDSDVPIVLSGVPGRDQGVTVAACVTTAEAAALEALLLGVRALLWRRPPTSDGVLRPDELIRVKPGTVTNRAAADDRIRWAASLVEWQWAEVI